MPKRCARILQLSDLHFFADPNIKLLEINPYETFFQVLELVKQDITQDKPDLVILSGDLSHDYSEASYKLVKKAIKEIPKPISAILGNHDVNSFFLKHLHDFNNKHYLFDNWQVILLNSHWPNKVAGHLTKKELNFLEKKLNDAVDKKNVIFLHHQVLPVHSEWLDKIGLFNSDALLSILAQHTNITLVVCGHVHQNSNTTRYGIDFISTPATSWQFACDSDLFKLDHLMPGYRWLNLYDDGSYQTGIVRTAFDEKFVPPVDIAGY